MRHTTVTLCLVDGFSAMVLSCLLEPLRAARDLSGAPIRWRITSLDGGNATSSSGLSITPDPPPDKGDLLILLAGYEVDRQLTAQNLSRLRHLSRRHDRLMAADAAPWFFARLGWLDGAEAVIHWQDRARLSEAHPKVRIVDAHFAGSGRILTCGGASSALSFMLHWIAEHFGKRAAFDVSRLFLHNPARTKLDSALPDRVPPALRRALAAMEETLETPLSLGQIAKRAGVSLRTLDRLFQTETQMSPARYYIHLRLSQAHALMAETVLSQAEIAARCGYGSAAALSKAYRALYGQSPGQTRRQAQP